MVRSTGLISRPDLVVVVELVVVVVVVVVEAWSPGSLSEEEGLLGEEGDGRFLDRLQDGPPGAALVVGHHDFHLAFHRVGSRLGEQLRIQHLGFGRSHREEHRRLNLFLGLGRSVREEH